MVRETRHSRRSRAKARREATRCSRRPRKVVNRGRQSRLESISLYRSVDERKLTKFYPSRPTVTDTRVDNEEKTTPSRGSRMARTSVSRPRRSYQTRQGASVFRFALPRLAVSIRTTVRAFCVYSERLLIISLAPGGPTMFPDWTKLWEEDVERV